MMLIKNKELYKKSINIVENLLQKNVLKNLEFFLMEDRKLLMLLKTIYFQRKIKMMMVVKNIINTVENTDKKTNSRHRS